MDARIANRQAIICAMANLLNEGTFEALSVTAICAEAGISRQTFYRCFKDKYAAAVWYVNGTLDATCRRIGRGLGWRSGYLGFFRVLEPNARFMTRLLDSDDYNSIYRVSMRSSEVDWHDAYVERSGEEPDTLLSYQMYAFSQMATILITDWVKAGCKPQADEYIDMFLSIVPHELFKALDQADDNSITRPLMLSAL